MKDTSQRTQLSQTPRIRSGARRIGAKHAHSKPVYTEKPQDANQLVSPVSTISEPRNETFSPESTPKPQPSYIQQTFDEDLGKSAKQMQNELKKEAADLKRREALLKARNPFISRFQGSLASEEEVGSAHCHHIERIRGR